MVEVITISNDHGKYGRADGKGDVYGDGDDITLG